MADAKMKVSQMGAVLAMDDDDLINVVTYNEQSQTYVSGKATGAKVKEYMVGDNDISALGDGTVTGAILEIKSESESADTNIVSTITKNGAHNLLQNNGTSQVINDVTFTVNADKSVTVSSSNNQSNAYFWVAKNFILPSGNYKVRGSKSGAMVYVGHESTDVWSEVGIDADLSITSDGSTPWSVFIYVPDGTSGTRTAYPMIRLASDPSTEYAPYAMTNGELTVHTVKDNFCQFAYNDNVCIGTLFVNNLNISTAGDWAEFYTIPSNVPKPKYGVTCPAVTYPYATDAANSAVCEISTTGSCRIYLETSSKRPVSQVTATFMYLI